MSEFCILLLFVCCGRCEEFLAHFILALKAAYVLLLLLLLE